MKKLSDKQIRRIKARLETSEPEQIVEHVRAALESEGFESLHDLIKEFKTIRRERDQLLQQLQEYQNESF